MSELWAVAGDQNTDIGGALIASVTNVFINNKAVIIFGDAAQQDQLCPTAGGLHCSPGAKGKSSKVFVNSKGAHRNNDERLCGALTVVTGQSKVYCG